MALGSAQTAFAQTYPPATTAPTVDNANPAPGEEVTIVAPPDTFAPGSEVSVVLGEELLARVNADAQGGLTARVTIPCETPPGPTTLGLIGTGPNGQPVTFSTAITVAEGECPGAGGAGGARGGGGALPRTGTASTTPLTAAGVGMVLIGAFAVATTRRRRSAQAIES